MEPRHERKNVSGMEKKENAFFSLPQLFANEPSKCRKVQ